MRYKPHFISSFFSMLMLMQYPAYSQGVKSPGTPKEDVGTGSQEERQQKALLQSSVDAALNWLHLIDEAKYSESWDAGSLTLRLKIPKKYWLTLMESIRKPMGSLTSRKLLDQRTAKNPVGLPKGDYMVLVFQASLSHKGAAKELVTLVLESDGRWRVLTYQVQ